MRIYLNTNVFGRPFDDMSQRRILEEALASINIFLFSVAGLVSVVVSDVLLAELSLIEDKSRRESTESVITGLSNIPVKINDKIINLATDIMTTCGIKDFMDCAHLATAASGNCVYFITCDDELIENRSRIEAMLIDNGYPIKIRNPKEFVEEVRI